MRLSFRTTESRRRVKQIKKMLMTAKICFSLDMVRGPNTLLVYWFLALITMRLFFLSSAFVTQVAFIFDLAHDLLKDVFHCHKTNDVFGFFRAMDQVHM